MTNPRLNRNARALRRGDVGDFGADPARGLISVLNGKITSICFEVGDGTATIMPGAPDRARAYLSVTRR